MLKPTPWIVLAGAALLGLAGMAMAQAPNAVGEVLRIDADGQRITLRHAGLPSLDMPAMTMTFRVRDPRLLLGVGVGDRVRFAAEKLDGGYVVTALVRQN
jgi:Cu/Ag efflux protein CusF